MLVLNCRIEFEGARKWTLTNLVNIKIERNADSMMDWCEIELPSRLRWDCKRECPLQREDKVNIWLGYNDELELAFKGYVINIYNLERLKIFCGNEMYVKRYKPIEMGTLTTGKFIDYAKKVSGESEIRIDESINLGTFYQRNRHFSTLLDDLKVKYGIKSFYVLVEDRSVLCFGRLINTNIRAVFDLEKNVVKNNLVLNRNIAQGIEINLISTDNRNKVIHILNGIGVCPYKKVYFRYRNLTENDLKDEMERLRKDYALRTYSGTITVFGGHLVEKYDLIGLKENGEKRGVYEVQKNVITFGLNGYRQIITLGNERRDAE